MQTFEDLKAFFAGDLFATSLGIEICSADNEGAICRLALKKAHCNALGSAQGGLVYSLADFTFAVAANYGRGNTVTLNSTIHYLKASHALGLVATARRKSSGRQVCVYEVTVTDTEEALVALATFTGYSKSIEK